MATRRRGLGRGLDALLGGQSGQTETRALPESGVASLDVDQLEPNRYQPRSYFDETGLEELAESIRHQGVVQPIVVTPRGEDRYTIIAGERRWRAARRAGLRQVPVVLRQVSDDRQILELALVENVQRADLNAVEEAEAYRTLGETFDLSQEEIAARVGKGRTTVTNAIRLLRLPRAIQDLIREGRLTAGQARPLLAIPDAKKQLETAERAVRDGLTARDLEALAAAPRKAETGKAKKKELDVNSRAAVEHLTRVLQTQVDIVRRKRGGTLHIRFHSEEELIRLYDLLIQRAE
jgi:ParB family chromosome partitioning protein